MSRKSVSPLANPVPFRPFLDDALRAAKLVEEGRYTSVGDAYREAVHRGLRDAPMDGGRVALIFERLAEKQEELVELLREAGAAYRLESEHAIDDLTESLTDPGANPATERLSDSHTGVRRVVIINTNRQGDAGENDERDMLTGEYAAVYYPKWQRQMENQVAQGTVVALYASGIGIIAYGTAKSKPERRTYARDKTNQPNDFETFVVLENFTRLSRPVSAREMKRAMQYPVVLHRAVRPVPEAPGSLLYELLKKCADQGES